MTKLAAILFVCLFGFSAHAQSPGSKTIDGYWQDTARRILFARDAPSSFVYGQWTLLDQQQTYPSAKQIRRSATGVELIDLLYDDEHVVKVLKASQSGIEFTRTTRWSGCSVHHRCGFEDDQLLCSLQTACPEAGGERVVWRGEERYARRAGCERLQSRPEAQGIPVVCR